jgi:NADPH:quinone reductase-like Zn-dependent oxidoreductase
MKAALCRRYGSPEVISLEETAIPILGDDDVLVEVRAASVNAADMHLMHGYPFPVRLAMGLTARKNPKSGCDFSGVISRVGKNVSGMKPGDAVFGDASSSGFGAFAQYIRMPAKLVLAKPANFDFEQSAALPMAAVTALKGLKEAKLAPGERILILGATGGVGSFAVQIAKAYGANVSCVCSSLKREVVEALKPDAIFEYDRQSITDLGQKFDVILDAAAYRPFFEYKKILTATGRYVLAGGDFGHLLRVAALGPIYSMLGKQKFKLFLSVPDLKLLSEVRQLAESGRLFPIIDRQFSLAELPNAMQHIESRKTKGKIVIRVSST